MNQQALEAAEKAVIKVLNDCVSSGIAWRPGTLALAHAALTAYAEATGERVVWKNPYNKNICCQVVSIEQTFPMQNVFIEIEEGHELVVRKVGT